jgi:hypothetical protein
MSENLTKLLLIMPPQLGLLSGFAAGLISLANFVTARMPDVYIDILDLSTHSLDDAKKQIVNSLCHQVQRLFVGITTTTASYQSALQIAQIVKTSEPKAITILGGHHASADPEHILNNHSKIVDVIVVGEGERSLCELLHNYPSLENIPGLAYMDDAGGFTRTYAPKLLSQEELDSIPITYGDSGFIGTPGKFDHVTYVSARGCPLGCAFCAVGHDQIRAKSISAVVRDIEKLIDMGFSRIAIEDNFFAHSPERTRAICKAMAEIKRRHKGAFAWDCQTRVESLARKGTINLMAHAGCEAVYIGVESFHSEHLAYLNKTTMPEKYIQLLMDVVVPSLLETKVDCYLNLQFGLPGETSGDEEQTCDMLATLGNQAAYQGKVITVFPQLHVVYPGTMHFHQGVVDGRFSADVFEPFTKWESQELPILFWLGEHFAHGTGGIPEGLMKSSLLREGYFEIDSTAVFRVLNCLQTIDKLHGIKVFRYGKYIVPKCR